MEKAQIALIPARWYASTKKAAARLEGLGVPKMKIYEAEKGETWDKITMRQGECLGVLDGLRAFGMGKREIHKAVDRFHSQGATILDIETGHDSRAHGPTMFDVATGPRRLLEADRHLMSEARADAYRKKHGMASKAAAHKIWHMVGPSIQAKVEATGWSRAALYNEFGRTGTPLGRRPKDGVIGERELPPIKVKSPRSDKGFVYFMRINGRGHVKIGYASDIKARLSGHGTSTPGKPVLVGWMHGTMTTEKRLHKKYADLRVKGEWFKFSGLLKAFVESLPETLN